MPQSRDEGSLRARFVLIGEAYGTQEAMYDRPFAGPSYRDQLLPWWREVGLTRDDFYITNCWDQGQPANINTISETEMRASFQRLYQRLAKLEDPWVIITTGNYSTYALTGNGRVSFHHLDGRHERPGIMDWRGSVLEYEDLRGRKIKLIPTLHPAFLFRSPQYEWLCHADWARIAEDGTFRERRLPETTRLIAPSKSELIEWIRWTRAQAKAAVEKDPKATLMRGRLACSLDVETPWKATYETRQKESVAETAKCRECGHGKRWHRDIERTAPESADGVNAEVSDAIASSACAGLRGKGGCDCAIFQPPLSKPRNVKVDEEAYLGCVGWSWDGVISMTAPTTLDFWQDPMVFAAVLGEIREFHADTNIDFGGQNFGFDAWWCAEDKIPLHAIGWDLMKMHRVQRPFSTVHDLATQASVDTRFPFWKHEAKLPDEISRWSHNKEQLWSYNGTDNCAQRQLLDVRWAALQAAGRLDYYLERELAVDDGLLELSRTGFRTDVEGRATAFEAAKAEAATTAEELNAAAGIALIGKGGGVSNPKLKLYLYGDGVGTPVYEKPLVENHSAAAKCTNCLHPRSWHVTEDSELVRGCTKKTKGLAQAMCTCAGFIAPKKLGKRVKVGEVKSGGLRLPEQYIRGADKTKHVSVNVVTIKRLMEQFPTLEKLQLIGKKVLRHRRLVTEQNFLKAERVVNGRHYAIFKQDTLLGRLSSSETPKGDGANLQNVDRKIRKFYLPDTGEEA